ncbi:phage gp6-like head-tail connector protein [Kitasatospora sp. NPDC091335]|uniref:phage gp6-like head-tail connector protein n=1 Tax=Kitasatospora sp. NPDC091335 TaxID=3364085 RepID=UPI00382B15F1
MTVVATDYATLDALKLALQIDPGDFTRDQLLTTALSAAARGIDSATGRRFWLDNMASARVYNPNGRTLAADGGERLVVDDIGDSAGLLVETGAAGTWTAVTGYETGPDNALVRGRPVAALVLPAGTWGYGITRVRVTARWGWPAVPDDIVQATLIQAARLYRRKDSPEGVTGSAEWGVVRLSRRDPDVWNLLEHFILPGFG